MRRSLDVLMRTLLASMLAGATLLGAPAVAGAATLRLTTTYPSVVADPGGSATFPLTITASSPGTVKLAMSSAPAGWTTTLRGGGSIVDAVYVGGSTAPSIDLDVKVPADAKPNTYRLTLHATDAAGGSASLDLEVRVPESSGAGVELSAQYPTLKGPASATYRFDVQLANQTSQQITFTLQVAGPQGWQVDARPATSTQAATAVVDAGGQTSIQVTATPPADVAADTYAIALQAVGGPAVAKADLQVEITGSYTLQVSTPDGRLNAQVAAGSASPLTLQVRNTGSAALAGVALTATPPQGWKVEFDPALVPAIAAGDAATVTANITPADDAVAGDYALTITARSDQASGSVDIRTTVQTSPLWGLVGLAAIGIVFVGLYLVFRRYGRR